jgi:hypothetical protein
MAGAWRRQHRRAGPHGSGTLTVIALLASPAPLLLNFDGLLPIRLGRLVKPAFAWKRLLAVVNPSNGARTAGGEMVEQTPADKRTLQYLLFT